MKYGTLEDAMRAAELMSDGAIEGLPACIHGNSFLCVECADDDLEDARFAVRIAAQVIATGCEVCEPLVRESPTRLNDDHYIRGHYRDIRVLFGDKLARCVIEVQDGPDGWAIVEAIDPGMREAFGIPPVFEHDGTKADFALSMCPCGSGHMPRVRVTGDGFTVET